MSSDEIRFYLHNREQITEWASLEKRADQLMHDAVMEGAPDKAIRLLKGDYGDEEVDFYMRNRALIIEWDALQVVAGKALHSALLDAAAEAGCQAEEGKRGWTSVLARSPELDKLRDDEKIAFELGWTKQDLLSTRRGYPFPRLALMIHPHARPVESRDMLVRATRAVAHELGMRKKFDWWAHWCMLDAIPPDQDLRSYANECVHKLQDASARLYPVLMEALPNTKV